MAHLPVGPAAPQVTPHASIAEPQPAPLAGSPALASVGGPRGSHAAPPRFATPVRLLLVLAALTSVLSYAQKLPCRDTRNWAHEFQYTRLCYTDVVALWGSEGLDKGKQPYLDHAVGYPVLLGAAMQLGALGGRTGQPSRLTAAGYSQDGRAARFFDTTALLLAAAALAAVACTALTAGRRPWDAALVAVAPALVLHAYTNWDLLAVAAAAGGLLAWSRRRPALAGLLLGLGIAAKLYPALLLLALLPLCVRAGRMSAWVRAGAAATATVLAVYLPVYLTAGYGTTPAVSGPSAWSLLWRGDGFAALAPHHGAAANAVTAFFAYNSQRTADWDSLPFALQYLSEGHTLTPLGLRLVLLLAAAAVVGGLALMLRRRPRMLSAVLITGSAALIALGFVVGPVIAAGATGFATGPLGLVTGLACLLLLAGVGVLTLVVPRRPRVAQVAFLAVVAFLLTNKVYSPQYVLWLLPLAALARPRWGMFLTWQLTEALLLLTRYLYFVSIDTSGRTGISGGWFVGSVLVRDLVLAVLAGLVVREMLRPELDVVRTVHEDDPAGGLLHGRDARLSRPAWKGRTVRMHAAPPLLPGARHQKAPQPDARPGSTVQLRRALPPRGDPGPLGHPCTPLPRCRWALQWFG